MRYMILRIFSWLLNVYSSIKPTTMTPKIGDSKFMPLSILGVICFAYLAVYVRKTKQLCYILLKIYRLLGTQNFWRILVNVLATPACKDLLISCNTSNSLNLVHLRRNIGYFIIWLYSVSPNLPLIRKIWFY